MRRIAALSIALALSLGCATRTTTTTVERPSGEVVERETTVETDARPGGVVSGTFDLIGEVIALPFRLIGGLFRVLF